MMINKPASQERMFTEGGRRSEIELLKVIAIFFIVLSHSSPKYGYNTIAESFINLNLATLNIQQLVILFFDYLGQIGNCIFVICSSYFLLESNRVNVQKIMKIILDSLIISIAFLGVFWGLGYDITVKEMLASFFPILFERNWFISCYLIWYALHPLLNLVIGALNKTQLLRINIFLVVMYCFINMLLPNAYYYTNLVGFITIYFIVAYMKIYLKSFEMNWKLNSGFLIGSIILLLILICCTNILGLHVSLFSDWMRKWRMFNNPLIVIMALSMFNLVRRYSFHNKIID